jgi:hypothetical protein
MKTKSNNAADNLPTRRTFILLCLAGILILILITSALMLTSCSIHRDKINDGTDPLSVDSSLLSNGFTSLDALGKATIKALNDSSAEALYKILVTEDEFRYAVFARTPDSLKAGLPWDVAWKWNISESEAAINRKLTRFGKKDLEFVGTEVNDKTTVFPGKTTYIDVRINAYDPQKGEAINLRFLDVVAMIGGHCKVVVFHK